MLSFIRLAALILNRFIRAGENMARIATFETSMGTFKAELYTEQMPITCGNFIDLANNGFYDGLHFVGFKSGDCYVLCSYYEGTHNLAAVPFIFGLI